MHAISSISLMNTVCSVIKTFLENYKRFRTHLHLLEKLQRFKTQLQDSSSKLINEAIFTGCPPKHPLSISCLHSVTPFFLLIQPPFICLIFPMSTFHQDSPTPPLTQKLYTFRTKRPKHFNVAHSPMLFLLSGIFCLVKLDTFGQPLYLKPP